MSSLFRAKVPNPEQKKILSRQLCLGLQLVALLLTPLVAARVQGTPFDTGFTALQTLFTGTVAKVASLIAIVIGGYQFARGEPSLPGANQRIHTGGHIWANGA